MIYPLVNYHDLTYYVIIIVNCELGILLVVQY